MIGAIYLENKKANGAIEIVGKKRVKNTFSEWRTKHETSSY